MIAASSGRNLSFSLLGIETGRAVAKAWRGAGRGEVEIYLSPY